MLKNAQFTLVHLVYQFTKLAILPLTENRGFPAPYVAHTPRVPRLVTENGKSGLTLTAEGVDI